MAARDFPFSTYKTYLYRNGAKLIDIKDFGEPLSPREQLDTTVVSSDERTFMPGIRERSKIQFTCNYTKIMFSDLKTVEAFEMTNHSPSLYAIGFGNSGEDGLFAFNAYLSVSLKSAGVNEVVEMIITLYPTSAVSFT